MQTRTLRFIGVGAAVLAVVLCLASVAVVQPSARAARLAAPVFSGQAAGVNGFLGGQSVDGAVVTLPANGTAQQATQASFNFDNQVHASNLAASTAVVGTTVNADASVHAINLTLAGGNTITADAATAHADVSCTDGNATPSGNTTVSNLVVNGVKNPKSPVNLPGFGTLTVDFRFVEGTGSSVGSESIALHIVSTDNKQLVDLAFASVHGDCTGVPVSAPPTGGGPIATTGERPLWAIWGALLLTLGLAGLGGTLAMRRRWLR